MWKYTSKTLQRHRQHTQASLTAKPFRSRLRIYICWKTSWIQKGTLEETGNAAYTSTTLEVSSQCNWTKYINCSGNGYVKELGQGSCTSIKRCKYLATVQPSLQHWTESTHLARVFSIQGHRYHIQSKHSKYDQNKHTPKHPSITPVSKPRSMNGSTTRLLYQHGELCIPPTM